MKSAYFQVVELIQTIFFEEVTELIKRGENLLKLIVKHKREDWPIIELYEKQYTIQLCKASVIINNKQLRRMQSSLSTNEFKSLIACCIVVPNAKVVSII